MSLKGQDCLRKLLPVDAGSDHGQHGVPVDIDQGWSAALRPERDPGKAANLAVAKNADIPVFRSATYAVHRDNKCKEVSSRTSRLIKQAQERARVFSAVPPGPFPTPGKAVAADPTLVSVAPRTRAHGYYLPRHRCGRNTQAVAMWMTQA